MGLVKATVGVVPVIVIFAPPDILATPMVEDV
jgi:hypothetical protein